jgi:CRISPR type III-A-associated protein Csm2
MDEVIDAVLKAKDKKKAIENFITLNESIIAYHKFYGGKD